MLKIVLKKFPKLLTNKLNGTYFYTDAVVDDARLVMRVIQESVQAGAKVMNYTKALNLLKDPKTQQVIGVRVEESTNTSQDNKTFEVKSSVVINATGGMGRQITQ